MSSSPTAAAAAPAQEDAEEYAAAADYYCGKTWQDASTTCQTPCPSGEDWECGNDDADAAGSGEITCHGFTGCSSSSSSTSSSATAASPNQPRPPQQQQQQRIQHLANNGGKLSAHDVYSSEDGAVTQLSYGIIFDIQTSSSSLSLVPMPIQIVALDIYTPIQNEIIYYELYYTKRDLLLDDGGGAIAIGGTTEDDDDDGIVVGLPQLDTFTLVMNGTIQSSSWIPPPSSSSSSSNSSSSNNFANNNVGELTRISINNNNNNSNNNTAPLLLLEGDGSRYSIYFTLNSRNLLYARERSSSTSLQYSWDEKEEEKNGDNATTTNEENMIINVKLRYYLVRDDGR